MSEESMRQSTDRKMGHLKIFFGYASGVGKTYAMLKAAHSAKQRGVNVLVGYIEPHTAAETVHLCDGLKRLPTRTVNHHGTEKKEFDLDSALRLSPDLILVDGLVHTNASSCRHVKRYQDIEELLKAGIDVYTTMNVQHLESLNNIMTSIIGSAVHDRIPDRVFDQADQVELVDIEPAELIERLKDKNTMPLENLVALREMAFRRSADRVYHISEKTRSTQKNDFYTDEHILVCISSSPGNSKIIRTAARMAAAFQGNFTALFVETSDFAYTNEENKDQLRGNMKLADQLGATVETVCGDDVAQQIAEFARISGVSKIVLGRSNAKRKHFFGKPSLTEQLTVSVPNLDIHIIPDQDSAAFYPRRQKRSNRKLRVADIGKSIGILAAATLIGYLFYHLGFSEANIITVYILGVLVTAVVTSEKIYSMIASVVSVLTFNFFFTIPRFSLAAYDKGYPVTFLIMLISAFITSSLAIKIKQHAAQSSEMAYRTRVLLETNQMLAQAENKTGIISVAANQLMKLLKRDVIFYDVTENTLATHTLFRADEMGPYVDYATEEEKSVAAWTMLNNKRAGTTTNTFHHAKCLYLAARIVNNVYGVFGIAIKGRSLDSLENSIVLSIIGECALALEKDKVSKEREESDALARSEQLRSNLLRSISHDLRTPLTSISGNAGVLMSSDDLLDKEQRMQLYGDIYDDSLWLINLVENLLSVTRIEEGSMKLHTTTELMEEVVEEALKHINRRNMEQSIKTVPSEDLVLAKMDVRLIIQVIINIVGNAIKYTPANSEITISTYKEGNFAVVEIADNGPGIPDEAKPHIFEMFYTANAKSADSRRGMGLGLALCKSIILAHSGELTLSDHIPHGSVFRFTLPAEEVTLHE